MRSHVRLFGCSLAVTLLAALPAWGVPTFNYTENFESVASGAKPPGWWTGCLDNSTNLPGFAALEPAVLDILNSERVMGWAKLTLGL